MSETYWNQIREMKKQIKMGDATPIIRLLEALEKKGLLHKNMLVLLCDSTENKIEALKILHSVAATYFRESQT